MAHLCSHYKFPSQFQRNYWILDPFILSQFISPILDETSSPHREKQDHQVVLHSLPDMIYFKKILTFCPNEDHTQSLLFCSIENKCFE